MSVVSYCNEIARAIETLYRHTEGTKEGKFVRSVQRFGEKTGKVTIKQLSVIGKLYWKHVKGTGMNSWWNVNQHKNKIPKKRASKK